MDSTMIGQIKDIAISLGIQARTVFIWWFIIKLGVNLIWAGFATLAMWRITELFGRFGRGQAMIAIASNNSEYGLNEHNYARAVRVLTKEFHPDPPGKTV